MELENLTECLDCYRDHFPGPHLDLVLASMIAGNTAGQIWSFPQSGMSPLLLLWDKGNNVIYLAGDSGARSALLSLATVVVERLRPQALEEGASHFKVRPLSPFLEESLSILFPDTPLRASPTLFLTLDPGRHLRTSPPSLPDVTIAPITPDLFTQGGLEHRDDVLDEIHWIWPSQDRFHTHGFGSVAIHHDEIVCWCTAEYVSPAQCGIGIATVQPHERRGLATATAAHFIQQARRRELLPCWECGRLNHASVRVAEKLGFTCEAEETYWIGSFI